MEEIVLTTQDGVKLYADYHKSRSSSAPTALLLHMMPAAKESWREFAEKLQRVGFGTLAIDFRGHGKSTDKNGKTINYKNFSDKEHQDKIIDVKTAIQFLESEDISKDQIFLIGASIGANLTLQYMSEYPEVKVGIVLSPGFDYRGIQTEKFAENLATQQAIYLAAGGDNDEYSTKTIERLYEIAKCKKEIKIVDNAGSGHGTDMFKSHPKIMDELIHWLKNIYN